MYQVVRTTTVAAASLIVALASVSTASAFWDKRKADQRVYRDYINSHNLARHAFDYPPRYRYGLRPDCRQYARRAFLTGNAYWRYAAYSCYRDYHRATY